MRSFKLFSAVFGLSLAAICHAASAEPMSFQEGVAALPDCGRICLGTAMANSSCTPADAACLCTDKTFNDLATECIHASCSVRETLTSKKITSLMCGITPSRDNSLIPLYSVFIGLAVVAVILRLMARAVMQAYFWWDDLANMFAFIGCAVFTGVTITSIEHGQSTDIWFVPFDDITFVLRLFFGQMLLYTTTHFFVRASIIFFYMRIFSPRADNKIGRILLFTMIFNIVYNFSFLIAVILQCSPVSHFWTQWEGLGGGKCGNASVLVWVSAATGVLFDLWLMALPFPQLFALNLSWKKKVMGGIMFFVGAAVIIIDLVRFKTISAFSHSSNPTAAIAQLCLWSGIELDVGVICPCLPSFRLLLRHLMPGVMGGSSAHRDGDPISMSASGLGGGSAMRKSMNGGMELRSGNGRIVVENTIAIKYGNTDDSVDGRSCASVAGLVENRGSSEGEEGGRGDGRKRSK